MPRQLQTVTIPKFEKKNAKVDYLMNILCAPLPCDPSKNFTPNKYFFLTYNFLFFVFLNVVSIVYVIHSYDTDGTIPAYFFLAVNLGTSITCFYNLMFALGGETNMQVLMFNASFIAIFIRIGVVFLNEPSDIVLQVATAGSFVMVIFNTIMSLNVLKTFGEKKLKDLQGLVNTRSINLLYDLKQALVGAIWLDFQFLLTVLLAAAFLIKIEVYSQVIFAIYVVISFFFQFFVSSFILRRNWKIVWVIALMLNYSAPIYIVYKLAIVYRSGSTEVNSLPGDDGAYTSALIILTATASLVSRIIILPVGFTLYCLTDVSGNLRREVFKDRTSGNADQAEVEEKITSPTEMKTEGLEEEIEEVGVENL